MSLSAYICYTCTVNHLCQVSQNGQGKTVGKNLLGKMLTLMVKLIYHLTYKYVQLNEHIHEKNT
jgi:L-amino acid N-acyltransferase YncA